MTNVGFIGTGRIGAPMAENVMQAGHTVYVRDIKPENYTDLVQQGAIYSPTPAAMAAQTAVIILSLFDDNDTETVLSGEEGLLTADINGKIIIDTSTYRPERAVEFAGQVAAAGGMFLESPVTGGTSGAKNGTLNVMVGGDKAAFERVEALLNIIGDTVVHIGPSGAGMVTKMANQMMMMGYMVTILEAFDFVRRHDVDMKRVFDVLETGGAQSGQLSNLGRTLLDQGDVDPIEAAHVTNIFYKDLLAAVQQGQTGDCYMPVSQIALKIRELGRDSEPGRDLLDLWEQIRDEAGN